jgi:adenylyltransferase/sulfurtransferase
MNKEQFLRYSRHILLPEVDVQGQEKLLQSRVLIIGLGGLGSPAAMYLAASGIGQLAICDFDRVDLSNLQRQILHRTPDLGRTKVESAQDYLRALNPGIEVIPLHSQLNGEILREQVHLADAVIDASDNFTTRFEINAACVAEKTPLVSGAVIRLEGQITVFRPDLDHSPCYACLYQHSEEAQETCAQSGVLAPVAGIIGAIQATEALKVLLGVGETLCGRLLTINARTMEWRALTLAKDPACPVCGRS